MYRESDYLTSTLTVWLGPAEAVSSVAVDRIQEFSGKTTKNASCPI
jgi:hypothetical protein